MRFLIRRSSAVPRIFRRSERGITMVETFLALVIASFMLLLLTKWLQLANNDMRAKRNADSLQQFTQIAIHYLDANRDAIIRVMNAENKTDVATVAEAQKFCVLNNDPSKPAFDPYKPSSGTHGQGTCAVDVQWLIQKNLLPAGFALTNPYGQKWVAIYRLVYAEYVTGTVSTQNDVEMLVAATGGDAVNNNELGMTMQLMGGVAGMYPSAATPVPDCAAGYICGPGGWKVDTTKFEFTY